MNWYGRDAAELQASHEIVLKADAELVVGEGQVRIDHQRMDE
jgi:hypothetical protein